MATVSEDRTLLRFVRHGATFANSAGLRCGSDLDLPMNELGHAQAERAAARVAQLDPPVGVIVTSDLKRTRETAAAIARRLPAARVVVEAALAERRIGSWNLMPIADSQPWFDARRTPPGGESDAEFVGRIARGLQALRAELPHRPLLVASKGVARVLGELVGLEQRLELENGELFEFDLSAQAGRATIGSTS
jgi:probable phosphoglycerate mutase